MDVREELRYTEDHEWVRSDDGLLRIGITDYAQDALGDVVYVELPEVGDHFDAGDTMAEVESTKSVAEVYAPLAGAITARNDRVVETPELVNTAPEIESFSADLSDYGGYSEKTRLPVQPRRLRSPRRPRDQRNRFIRRHRPIRGPQSHSLAH